MGTNQKQPIITYGEHCKVCLCMPCCCENNTKILMHTPEPWEADEYLILKGENLLFTAIDSKVNGIEITTDAQKANAKRIVECVNACAGIHDPSGLIAGADIALIENKKLKAEIEQLKIGLTEKFSRTQIEHLQYEIYKITNDGEIMSLFNKLLGVNAG